MPADPSWRGHSCLPHRDSSRRDFAAVRRAMLGALVFTLAASLPAQTLQQAEALWKARRYQDANTEFRDLAAREPRNPAIRVRWGRMYLEHWQADEADRLFNEALELKPNDAEALLGKALVRCGIRCAASRSSRTAPRPGSGDAIAPTVDCARRCVSLGREDRDARTSCGAVPRTGCTRAAMSVRQRCHHRGDQDGNVVHRTSWSRCVRGCVSRPGLRSVGGLWLSGQLSPAVCCSTQSASLVCALSM